MLKRLIPISEGFEELLYNIETLFKAGLSYLPSATQLLGYSETGCDWRVKLHNALFTIAEVYFTRAIAFPMLLKIRVSSICCISQSLYLSFCYLDLFLRNVFK